MEKKGPWIPASGIHLRCCFSWWENKRGGKRRSSFKQLWMSYHDISARGSPYTSVRCQPLNIGAPSVPIKSLPRALLHVYTHTQECNVQSLPQAFLHQIPRHSLPSHPRLLISSSPPSRSRPAGHSWGFFGKKKTIFWGGAGGFLTHFWNMHSGVL